MNYISYTQKYIGVLLILTFASCGTSGYEFPDDEEPKDITRSAPVPADGILETVTWNIEWFGDGSGGNGPNDEFRQAQYIAQVMDSLQADLYAFQEVYSQQALNNITRRLTNYNGFVANHIDWIQKMAFVYNTNTIDSLTAGPITNGQDKFAWANGRFPLYFHFNYSYQNRDEPFYAIVIHAKAFDDQQSYERRKKAAQDLYDYLMKQKPNANVIFLGDYNDDVDVSIYNEAQSPYYPFVADSENFRVLTAALSQTGKASTTGYDDMIDHITVSNELFDSYIGGSAAVYTSPETFIPNYEHTTSDHYPVWTKFDISREPQNKLFLEGKF